LAPAQPPFPKRHRTEGDRVTAVLGPTNTGKTHYAIERMLGHKSAIMGFPLRLLAREVFDRVRKVKGPREVALITGEEKIVPKNARYFICTVEAMPLDMEVDFLAIDEIQLAADRERGHTFTDRLLRARGQEETLVLGSETARGLIARLLPDTKFVSRPRYSELSWTGAKKITRLPRRSAVVAFSSDRVYALAELIRRQRGGAAIVMGALSPRTRNAQVELYQSGEVDFLVATDAIGMGLNMDVDHVAFAATRKFDGHRHRDLKTAELAQIAGRAGRYLNDGSFGVTGEVNALAPEAIQRIEAHEFEPEHVFQWRNPNLDFSSLQGLIRSLDVTPRRPGLMRTPEGDDVEALQRMAQDPQIQDLARAPAAIHRLWEVVQVPDFRKTLHSEHVSLLSRLYSFLMDDACHIPEDWIGSQVTRLDRTEGDIDTLSNRIAHIRTWTYIANRADWLADPAEWQQKTREVEDKLSDALHERLMNRFIDRRTSVLMRRLRQNEDLMGAVTADGEVLVEGEFVGRLSGFVFVPDPRAEGIDSKALRAASEQAVSGEIRNRATALAKAGDGEFHLSEHGRILWRGHAVADLERSEEPLKPGIKIIAGEELNGPALEEVRTRLGTWMDAHVASVLEPLIKLRDAPDVEGLARGVAFRLVESLGAIPRDRIADDVKALEQPARAQLRKYGVRFGAYSVYLPALLKPHPARLKLLLWALHRESDTGLADLPAPPAAGLTSADADMQAPEGFYNALGFRVCGERAVRLDMLERLADLIRPEISSGVYKGGFVPTPDMMSLVGCSGEAFGSLLKGLGYRVQQETQKLPRSKIPAAVLKELEAPQETPAEAEAAPDATAPPDGAEMAEENREPGAGTEAVEAESDAAQTASPPPTETVSEEATPQPAAPASETAASADVDLEDPDLALFAAATAGAFVPDGAAPADETIEVKLDIWRPARRGPRQERGRPQGRRRQQRPMPKTADAPAEGGKPADRAAADSRREDGPPREKKHGPKRKGRKPQRPTAPKEHRASPPGKQDRGVDPDSPFAALAVLKERQN